MSLGFRGLGFRGLGFQGCLGSRVSRNKGSPGPQGTYEDSGGPVGVSTTDSRQVAFGEKFHVSMGMRRVEK